MRNTTMLLKKITELLPLTGGRCHCLSVRDDDTLQLSMFGPDGGWHFLYIHPENQEKSVDELIARLRPFLGAIGRMGAET